MRSELADRLLAKVLNWDIEDVSKYRPEIDILSKIKYDEYQQYFPGLRFTESLASWLNQMEQEDRNVFFQFVIKRLIFISTREMNQLVSQAFPDFIRPIIYKGASELIGCSEYHVNRIEKSKEYRSLLRKTLFLGLSDGARTDVIRRFNPFISHEQVLPFYLIPEEKFAELLNELEKDLSTIPSQKGKTGNKFSTLVLLDDFTASGTSYFKYLSEEERFTGKINKILKNLKEEKGLGKLFDPINLKIILIIYIATAKAVNIINQAIVEWKKMNQDLAHVEILFEPVYHLPDSINITSKETELCKLLEKYYDPSIETGSYLKGKTTFPFLGFDEGGLPLILNHNTPNNSIAILWNELQPNAKEEQMGGLFPRVSRHKK